MAGIECGGTRRREILSVGGLGLLGLSLGDFFRARSARADAKSFAHFDGTAKNVIQIWLPGGQAHQETFDPKPLAPAEYRGDMGVIDTALPGVQFNERLVKTAAIADRLTVVRSMTHGEAAHERGRHNMFTGYRPSPALTYPSFGAVVSHELGPHRRRGRRGSGCRRKGEGRGAGPVRGRRRRRSSGR
jgi:hypothetical protein